MLVLHQCKTAYKLCLWVFVHCVSIMFLPFELKCTSVRLSVTAHMLGGMEVRGAAKVCMFYSLERGEIRGFCHSVFCIAHEWSLPKRVWFPISTVGPRVLLQLRALCKELGKRPLPCPAPFLVTEALGSSEAEVGFSQVNKEETPVGICQQPSIIMLEMRFELRHL